MKKSKVVKFILYLFLLALLIGFLVPAITPPTPSKKIVCSSHLRHLSVGFQVYHQKNQTWPEKEHWCDTMKLYLEEEQTLWLCPFDQVGPCSYAMNKNIPANANNLPPDLVVLFESTPGWNRTGGPEDVITNRHDKKNPGSNIAFADGHVEFITADKIPALQWTINIHPSAPGSK